MYSKMRDFLNCQGIKYLAPAKAGEDAERMVEYRELGQEARQEFTHLVSDFQKLFPHLKQDRTSQWMIKLKFFALIFGLISKERER